MITPPTKPPYQLYKRFVWADLVEILAVINRDRCCAKGSFLDRFFATKKDFIPDVVEGHDEDELPSEDFDDTIKTHDGREKFRDRVFAVIHYRISHYGDKYPFRYEDGVLYALPEHDWFLSYCYLLLASHTAFIDNKNNSERLTSDFELLSSKILEKYLGDRATVHVFGAGDSRDPLFEHNCATLGDKFKKLVSIFRGEYLGKQTDPALRQVAGDGGLDLVAHFNFTDSLDSRLLVYGQCKCSDEWPKAIGHSSDSSFRTTMTFKAPPTSFMFIPFCFRNADGHWASDSKVSSIVLFDRFRILEFLTFDIVPVLPKSYTFLQRALSISESIT